MSLLLSMWCGQYVKPRGEIQLNVHLIKFISDLFCIPIVDLYYRLNWLQINISYTDQARNRSNLEHEVCGFFFPKNQC